MGFYPDSQDDENSGSFVKYAIKLQTRLWRESPNVTITIAVGDLLRYRHNAANTVQHHVHISTFLIERIVGVGPKLQQRRSGLLRVLPKVDGGNELLFEASEAITIAADL